MSHEPQAAESEHAAAFIQTAPSSEPLPGPREGSHAILLVDDERHITSSLERMLRKEGYRILTASGGREALETLAREQVSLIISDHRMPEMSGAELLQRVRELYPDTLRMMLTGYADINSAMAAINEGQVLRFITKPWDDQELRLTIRDALHRLELTQENRRLQALTQEQNEVLRDLNENLEKKVAERTQEVERKNHELEGLYKRLEESFFEVIRVFHQLIEIFDPVLGGHSKRAAALSSLVAGEMGLTGPEQELVEIAGLLHDIGLIGLPREVLMKGHSEMSPHEAALFRQHPVLGFTALAGIEQLGQVAVVIKTHHESFGGGGFPGGLRGEEIPLGGRIINAVSLYDDLVHKEGRPRAEAMEELGKLGGSELDPEVIFNFQAILKKAPPARMVEVVLSLSQLKPGMVLSRNLKTVGGRLLLPEKAVLQQAHIEKVRNFSKIDPIAGGLYVYQPTL